MDFDLNSPLVLDSLDCLGGRSENEVGSYTSDDEIDERTGSESDYGLDDEGVLAEDYNSDAFVGDGEKCVDDPGVSIRNEISGVSMRNEIPGASNSKIRVRCNENFEATPPVNATVPSHIGAVNNEDNIMCQELEKRLVVGSNVRDLDEAYVLYCEYGRLKGFGIRKGDQRYIGRSDNIKWKEYMCCCAGLPDPKSNKDRIPSFKKILIRTGCKAKLRVSRLSGAPWCVSIFVIEHNHSLVPAAQTYMLRSARNLSTANTLVLEALRSSGIGVSGAFGFMEKQCSGPENLGFTRHDAYDHFGRKRKLSLLENADSNLVMQYFRDKANEEPFYYWNAQTDDEGRLVNLFFRDLRSAEYYRAFGDVLSLDTTYRTNMYNLICAPFVGINHHTFTILFGMGFLSDESTTSFEWLFKEFLKSMDGVQPKVVFTDQCMAMMKAIETIFPESKHNLCQWHINRNATKKFGSLNLKPRFKKLWHRCMNEVETEAEFDEVWKELMTYTNPKNNSWFMNMYKLRRRWASVFTQGIFTGGLLATSRSEGTNRVVKSVQKSIMTLYEFVMNYEELKKKWRRREMEEDTLGTWLPGQLVSENALFLQAASRYTHRVYKKFEAEATRTFDVVLPHDTRELGGGKLEFSASTGTNGRARTVIFNTNTYFSSCSCRKWESEGLLCRHILKVYYFMNHFSIPESQILKRWTKTAKEGCFLEQVGPPIRSTLSYMFFLNTSMRHLYEMACCCVDNEGGRSMIIERLESLRRELFQIVGLPQSKQNRKVLNELSGNVVNPQYFRDPRVVKEKGIISAREVRALQAQKNRGTHEAKKKMSLDVSLSLLPRVLPFETIEQVRSSPSLYPPHSARWKIDDGMDRASYQP